MQVGQTKHRVDCQLLLLEIFAALVNAVNKTTRKDFRKRGGGRIHAAIATLDGLALLRHLAGHSLKGHGAIAGRSQDRQTETRELEYFYLCGERWGGRKEL